MDAMAPVMAMIAKGTTVLFDLLFLPFGWSPFVGITVYSVLCGALFLKLYALSTNQDALKDVNRRIGAPILEVRLFQQDLSVLLAAQKKLFAGVFGYMWQAMRAIFLLLPPAVLIMTQFVVRMGMEPVRPAEVVEVTVQLSEDAPPEAWDVQLVSEGAVEVLGDRFPGDEDLQYIWKVKASRKGTWPLTVVAGADRVEASLAVSEAGDKLYNRVAKGGFFEDMLWPGGPRIDGASAVESVEIGYGWIETVGWVFGNWFGLFAVIWYFGIVSLVAGLALKDKMGVEL